MTVKCKKRFDDEEFIMRVEECFGVSIPFWELDKVETAGDLFACLRQKIAASSSGACLTAKAFYRLRRSLMDLTGRPRDSIRPDTMVEELLPKATRRQQWDALEQDLGRKLPKLWLPNVVVVPMFAVMCSLLSAGYFGFPLRQHWMPLILWPMAVAVLPLGIRFMRPMATEIRGCRTVGKLATLLLGAGCEFAKEGASDGQIWEGIVGVLGTAVGLEAWQITPELRFEDLPTEH